MIEKRAVKREDVSSSNIKSIGYMPLRRKLEVEFKSGDIYRYGKVPGYVFKDFQNAPSKGKFLNDKIKYFYPYRKHIGKDGEKSSMGWKRLERKTISEAKESLEKAAALNSDIKLYPHQQRVVDNPNTSMVVAHGVGSGKTLTSIAKFEKMKETGQASRALVVVPAGLRKNYGDSGVGKFTNSTYNVIGNSAERSSGHAGDVNPKADYNIISYEMFRRNPEHYIQAAGADTVILDEVHRTKNEGTATSEALRRVRPLYKNHIGLTGSLVSNSVSDLQPLVHIATNGQHSLGKNKAEFDQKWIIRDPSRKYRDLHPSRIPIKGFRDPKSLGKELNKHIDFLSSEEAQVLADMPGKRVNVVKVPLSHQQSKLYRRFLEDDKSVAKMIKTKRLETIKNDEAAAAYNKLTEARKLMNDVSAFSPGMSLEDSAKNSPKTKRLLDDLEKHLQTNPEGQGIVLTNLIRGGADIVGTGLKQRNIPSGHFLGKGVPGITEESRQADVEAFKKRRKRAIVVSPAGGEGLSLGDTTWEGVLDPHFNPERMNQMEARGIRSGGLKGRPDRNVEVNRYISTMPKTLGIFKSKIKTPDEFVYEIAQNKAVQNQKIYDLMKKYK